MNLYSQVMQLDFFLLLTVVFLGFFLKINRSAEKELNTKIKISLAFIALLALAENIEVHFGRMTVYSPMYKFGATLEALLWVLVLLFAVRVIRNRPLTVKEKLWLYLPAVANVLLVVPGFFTDFLMTLDENNVLHKDFTSYFPVLLGTSYFFFVIHIGREQLIRGFREEATILLVGDCAVLIGAMSGLILDIHGLMGSAITLTLTFYYLYLHMDHSKRDMLTGALTRACFFADLDRIKPENLAAFCEFDMNNLKTINDQQGHQAGDDAIVFMYRLIIGCLPTNGRVYRFGGDEFAVLFFDVNMSTVYGTIYKIREQFDASEYGCAIGIAEWKPGMTFQEVYSAADQEMYEDKKRQKADKASVMEKKTEMAQKVEEEAPAGEN